MKKLVGASIIGVGVIMATALSYGARQGDETSLIGIKESSTASWNWQGDPQTKILDSLNVRFIGLCDSLGYAFDLAVCGSCAWVVDSRYQSRFRGVNVSDPANPFEEGLYQTQHDVRDVAISDNYAYVACNGGLAVINVSDPVNPYEEGFCDSVGGHGVAISESHAYVADWSGLRVVNVSDPAHPYEEGFCPTPLDAYDVVISGSYAYVACIGGLSHEAGMSVINVSDPVNPHEEGFCDSVGGQSVAISGSYVYVGYYYKRLGSGLQVVNVSDPTNPREEGFYSSPDLLYYDVAVSGSYAYITGNLGLRVVNVRDPAYPYEEGYYDTPGFADGVAVSGKYAYVADGTYGLIILEFTGGTEVEEDIGTTEELPTIYSLSQNYPNPFNASTWIRYKIAKHEHVTLKVFNTLGQEVQALVNGNQLAGWHAITWDGRDASGREVASGLYFCCLQTGEFSKTRKMVLLK